MRSVFVLQHVHFISSGQQDVKLIGVYRSLEAAHAAINRLHNQPGFADHRRLVDPLTDDDANGFYIDEYELDKDHWSEGFVTV
jgi:hypothetical protein